MRADRPLWRERCLAAIPVLLWTLVSPWIWGYANVRAVHANHIALAMAALPLALLATALAPAAVLLAVAGAWLSISPWVLGYADAHAAAWANDLLAGLALLSSTVQSPGARSWWAAVKKRREPTATASSEESATPPSST